MLRNVDSVRAGVAKVCDRVPEVGQSLGNSGHPVRVGSHPATLAPLADVHAGTNEND